MTESIVVAPRKILEEIGDEIVSGDIAQRLNKPYNYILFKYATSSSSTFLRFATTFIVGAIVTTIFVGGIEVNLLHLPMIILSVFLALTLHFLFMALLGVFAFWIEDAKAMHFVYQKFVFVLGGMLLPLEIFPSWLENISKVLPFSYIAYHPAKLWVMFSWSRALEVIVTQLGWIIVFIVLITVVYKICIRRISINGG